MKDLIIKNESITASELNKRLLNHTFKYGVSHLDVEDTTIFYREQITIDRVNCKEGNWFINLFCKIFNIGFDTVNNIPVRSSYWKNVTFRYK